MLEQLLADMEFKESDTDAEREQKLQVLQIYSKRLDKRKRRKEFFLERNLLYPDQFEMSLSAEERKIYKSCKVFARLHSKEEHKELVKKVIEEHRIRRRIQDLQEARKAGCRTTSEANRFIEEKSKKEAEEIVVRLNQGASPHLAKKREEQAHIFTFLSLIHGFSVESVFDFRIATARELLG